MANESDNDLVRLLCDSGFNYSRAVELARLLPVARRNSAGAIEAIEFGDGASISSAQAIALATGNLVAPDGGVLATSEATPYVTLTATGTAFSGPCELAGWYCSVAAGNITVYDNTSATGTPIVPTTALVAGPMPIFGPGTNSRMLLTTGCHVVLSGAATVRVAVGA